MLESAPYNYFLLLIILCTCVFFSGTQALLHLEVEETSHKQIKTTNWKNKKTKKQKTENRIRIKNKLFERMLKLGIKLYTSIFTLIL